MYIYSVLVFWEYDDEHQVYHVVAPECLEESEVKRRFLKIYGDELELDSPEETEQHIIVTQHLTTYNV